MNGTGEQKNNTEAATTRRKFLTLVIGVFGSVNAIVLGLPFVRSLVSVASKRKAGWSRVTEVGSLPEGQPVEVKFSALKEDAYHYTNALYSVWVIKHSHEKVTVFSPVCPHLGCHFLWDPKVERFECPCHASEYSLEGKVLYGPAPRSLDVLPHKIEQGVLFVQWERFKVGTPEKIVV
ncbi:MAG TPA: ubiquinol-cytochrome c reductase iron-sulfur subunit [Thermodesulfovibrionales bacterium]|nr:ubiquinol-cytochrome c reductase iron-sulfur subunit [Thermodesulfovibrionales bacterium]